MLLWSFGPLDWGSMWHVEPWIESKSVPSRLPCDDACLCWLGMGLRSFPSSAHLTHRCGAYVKLKIILESIQAYMQLI